MFVVTVEKDQEVPSALRNVVAGRGILNAATILVGAVHEATVSVMRKNDPQQLCARIRQSARLNLARLTLIARLRQLWRRRKGDGATQKA